MGTAVGAPDPGEAEPFEAWAIVVGVVGFAGLCVALGGLLFRRRWGFVVSLATAALLFVDALASLRDDRAIGGWFLQTMSLAVVGVVSGLAWRRAAP